MTRRSITIATWDYDRVRAIMNGRVVVEGCDVNFLALAPEECFHRTYINHEFEVAEIGFSPQPITLSRGTESAPGKLTAMVRSAILGAAGSAAFARPGGPQLRF